MKKIIIEDNLKNFLINEKTPILIKVLNFLSCFLSLSLQQQKMRKKYDDCSEEGGKIGLKFPAFLVKTLFLILSLVHYAHSFSCSPKV